MLAPQANDASPQPLGTSLGARRTLILRAISTRLDLSHPPHGVTNERLDEASDYYRYRPQNGELWTHADAAGYAVVANGRMQRIVLTSPGAGYSSPPVATVDVNGVNTSLKVTVKFEKDLKKNGSVQGSN